MNKIVTIKSIKMCLPQEEYKKWLRKKGFKPNEIPHSTIASFNDFDGEEHEWALKWLSKKDKLKIIEQEIISPEEKEKLEKLAYKKHRKYKNKRDSIYICEQMKKNNIL